jgi:hypothetical protein
MDVTSLQDLPGMETYKPEEPSGITIRDVVDEVDGKTRRVRTINLGIQDAERARHFGRELAGYEFDAVQGRLKFGAKRGCATRLADFSRALLLKRRRRRMRRLQRDPT